MHSLISSFWQKYRENTKIHENKENLILTEYAISCDLFSYTFTPDGRQTPDQPPTIFYGLVGYDREKITRSNMKSVSIPDQPRCIRAVSLMYPR